MTAPLTSLAALAADRAAQQRGVRRVGALPMST